MKKVIYKLISLIIVVALVNNYYFTITTYAHPESSISTNIYELEAPYVLLSEGNDSTIFINCNVLEGHGNIASNNTIELNYNTNNLRGDINNAHWAYENFVQNTFLPDVYENSAYYYSDSIVDSVLDEYIGTNLNALAKIAKEAYDDYKDNLNDANFRVAAYLTMRKTQEYTTAYLIKFYNDVNSSSTPYIKNNTEYYIRNKSNNKYLKVNNNFDIEWSNTNDASCRFTIMLDSNGYYSIRRTDSYGIYITDTDVGLSQFNYNCSKLKIIPNGTNYYNIYVKSLDRNFNEVKTANLFKNVLLTNGTSIKGGSFTPNDTCYWELIKC